MAEIKTKIPAEMEPAAVGGMVADAKYIIDRVKNKTQEEVNADTEERVSTLEESVGTGGSVDERIAEEGAKHYLKTETYSKTELNNMITTPNQEYVSVIATAQTTAVTDVLPATGAADTTYRVGNWDGTQYNDSVFSEYAWNGSAYVKLSTKSQVGEVYDISANHAGATYADLSAALGTNGANIPQSLRKGGMSVKYVQSSDNKYVQARCMAQNFTTDITQWQVTDNTPTTYSYPSISKDELYGLSVTRYFSYIYYTPQRNIRRVTGLSCMIRSNWVPTETAKLVAYKPNDIIILRELTVEGGLNEFQFEEPVECDTEHEIALYLARKEGDSSWTMCDYEGGVFYVAGPDGNTELIPQSQYFQGWSDSLCGIQFYNTISFKESLENEIRDASNYLQKEIDSVSEETTSLKNKTYYRTDWEDCGGYDATTNTILSGNDCRMYRIYLGGKSVKYSAKTYLEERYVNIMYEKNGSILLGCRFNIDNRNGNWQNILIGNNGINADAIIIHTYRQFADDSYFSIEPVDISNPEETYLLKRSGLISNVSSFISMPLGIETSWFMQDHSNEYIGIQVGVQSYFRPIYSVIPNTTIYAKEYTACAELADDGMVIATHYATSDYSFITNNNTKYILENTNGIDQIHLSYNEEAFDMPYLIDTNITSTIGEITKYKAPSTYYIQEILKDYSSDYLKGKRILFNGDSFLHGHFVAENMYQFIQNKHPLSDVIFGGFSGRTMAYVPAVSGDNSVVNSLTGQVSLYAQTKSTLYYSLTSGAELTRSELNLVIFEGISAVDEVRLYNGAAATFFNVCSYNETTGVITDLFVSGWNNEVGENHVYLGKTIHALEGECIAIRSSANYIGSANSQNLRYVADNEHTFKGRVNTTGEIVTIQGSPLVQVLCTNLHYCILQGGLNDMYNRNSIPLGTITDGYAESGYDDATFVGALEHSFSKVIRGLPTTHLGFIIMPQGFDVWRDSYVTNIKAVCEKWGVAYLDYEKIIGTRCLNLPVELTREWWRTNPNGADNGHPNQYMYDTMNTMLDKFIMDIF